MTINTIGGNAAKPNRGVIWCRSDDGEKCLPFYKYGSGAEAEYFDIPQHYWPVFQAHWNPEYTPYNERGRLNEDATRLYY